MLESSMETALYKRINQPVRLLYYYRDETPQDGVVRVKAMQQMLDQLATPHDKKRSVPMPATGNHVLGSYIKSKDVEGVEKEIEHFMINTLGIKPRNPDLK